MARRALFGLVLASLVAVSGPVSAAVVQEQPFEHETWDELPDQDIAEAIEALRTEYPYLADVRSLDMTRTRRVGGYSGHALEIVIPPGGFRGFGPYARLPQPVDQAFFRYYVYLADFRPVSSGKLPGLADASLSPSAKGCIPSTPADPGWSARMMFDAAGTAGAPPGEVPIGYYLYHLGQVGDCGDEMIFGSLRQGRWTCIEGQVKMNTPGVADGSMAAWMDGELVHTRANLAFRRPGESVAVREMWDNVYFGGAYPTPNRLGLILDEMVVSDTGRVGCIDPFLDDNHTVHAPAMTELYARRLLFGCGERLVCPEDPLTRAQFAVMIHRLLGPPPGPDAFTDDEGHWAESVFNSLSAAGTLRGCDPPANTLACPDATVTRAQVGAIVRRALGLPPGPDAFTDDDGTWAEADIDALAAAGITNGCEPGRYCPDDPMKRMEAATFMLRADDLLQPVIALAASPAEWPPEGPPPVKPLEERE